MTKLVNGLKFVLKFMYYKIMQLFMLATYSFFQVKL